jgi:ABC-2 type transport system ATP-binding protein
MTAAVVATGLGKRYGTRWALQGCTVQIPSGRIAGLVGPNGAGKSTLLKLAVGLLRPTTGTIEVVGGAPATGPKQLGRVGFLAQDAPVYSSMSVADHLRFAAHLNPTWDAAFADERIRTAEIDRSQKAGQLSGGQRAQLALTLALAKRPDLLVLDEPVASLDPLARRQFLQALTGYAAEHGISVVLSSHLVADLERVCDFMVLLSAAHVQLADDVEDLLGSHRRLIGPRRDSATLPSDQHVVTETHTDRQSTLLVRTSEPVLDPAWKVEEVSLEEIVLAYMGRTDIEVAPRGRRLGALR